MNNDLFRFLPLCRKQMIAGQALLFCSLLFFAYHAPAAEPIYKSIDRHGNVSYASTRVANAVTSELIAPPPKPNKEDVRRAEEALEAYRIQTEKERQERLAWEKERIRDYRKKAEAYQPPPPEEIKRIIYPPYYYCPFYPYYPHASYHPDRRPLPRSHKTFARRHKALVPDHRTFFPHQKPAIRAHRAKLPHHKYSFPRHKSFSSDTIFLPAKRPVGKHHSAIR